MSTALNSQNSIVPSDRCKTELNSARSIRSIVAYQYYLLCIPFPPEQNRRTPQGLGKGEGKSVLRSAATVKRATKTCNLFCMRILPSRSQTCLATYPVAWILASGWIKIHGTHVIHRGCVTCCKTSLPWAGKTRSMCTLLQNKKLLSTFCQNFSELETNTFVARQVWFLGGNMRNIAFHLTLQQWSKTSSTFLLPVSPYLYYGNHNPVSNKKIKNKKINKNK